MVRGFLLRFCLVFFQSAIRNSKSAMRGGGYHESRKDQGKEPDRCEEKGPGLLLLQSRPVGGILERVLQALHYRWKLGFIPFLLFSPLIPAKLVPILQKFYH